jgi:hypothetical protein
MSKRESTVASLDERVWLAAFGKHPGWNDHLDDIGLETDRLVAVRRSLYVDGIGGVIGAGTWEAMDEASRDEGFSHSFLWRQPDGLVVGRMWSSSDGKGRKKYPMIVCAMCRSLPLSFVAGPVLDRLRRLEDECKSVTAASGVISAVDRARGELRELASHTPAVSGQAFEGEASASRLASAPVIGGDGQGLCRVMYQMDRDMAAYLNPETVMGGSRSRTMEVRAQHMRVPRVFERESECWSVWARLFLTRVDQLAPLLLICRDGRGWLDVIVGEPGSAQLGCLQSTGEAVPLTTDIPFTIDEKTASTVQDLIRRARSGELIEHDPGFIDASSERMAPFLKTARRSKAQGKPEAGRKQMMLAVAGAAVVLLICVVLAMSFFGGSGQPKSGGSAGGETGAPSKDDGDPPPAAPTAQAPGPSALPPPAGQSPAVATGLDALPPDERDRVERFRAWCVQMERWYTPFVEALDRAALERDPDLNRALLARLIEAERAGLEINPFAIAPRRYRSLSALIENPPAELGDPSYEARIAGANAHIDAVRGSIGPSWGGHAALAATLDGLERSGRQPHAELVSIRAALTGEDGAAAARAAAALVPIRGLLERIAGGLGLRHDSIPAIRAAGAVEQAAWFEGIPVAPAPEMDLGTWLESTARQSESTGALGAIAARAARDDLPSVDPALLAAALTGVRGEDPERDLRAWLAAVSDPALRLLDPTEDPRRALAGGAGLDGLEDRLSALAEGDERETRAISARAARWREDLSGLLGLAWSEANRPAIADGVSALLSERSEILGAVDGLERARRLKGESYLAEIRGKRSASTTGSAALDEVWRSARDVMIGAYERDRDLVALSRAVDAALAALEGVESAMPPVEVEPGAFGTAGARVAELIVQEREARLASAARRALSGGSPEEDAAAYAIWSDGVLGASADAGALLDALRDWRNPDEAVDGASPRDRLASWSSSWVGQRVGPGELDPALGVLAQRVLPGDRAALAAILTDASVEAPVLHVVWSMLGRANPRWPLNAAELELDAGAIARLRARLGTLPAARRGEVEPDLSAGAAARWSAVAASASGWDEFRPLALRARSMGVDAGAIAPELAFDLWIAGLTEQVGAGRPLDGEQILEAASRWLEAGPGDAEAGAWLSDLVETLSGRKEKDIDYRAIGPARAGWSHEAFDGGRRLVYSWIPNGQVVMRLGFRLVESPAGAFYLSESEAPAVLLLSYALEGNQAGSVLGVLEEDWRAQGDPRRGPRVWEWRQRGGGRKILNSRNWTGDVQGDEREYYAAAVFDRVGKPEETHPLQRISPHAAAVLAALAGCRLPTEAEWHSAYESIGRPAPGDAFNLRDSAFESQRVFTEDRLRTQTRFWPDEGIFLPEGSNAPRGASARAHAWADGRLWFEPVEAEGDRPFRHLVGNVAEFVLMGTPPPGLMTDRADGLAAALPGIDGAAKGHGVFGVIGGSALSPPDLPVDRAAPVPSGWSRQGYSDVGFRLAFSPGLETPLIVQVGEALRSAPFLRPEVLDPGP